MKTLTINCSKQYEITIGSGILYKAGRCIAEVLPACKVCIVSDGNVKALYGGDQSAVYQSLLSAGFDVYEYTFTPGEKSKTLETAGGLLDFLADRRFSREDALIALGGGVTGDITGFAAATYMRGIRYIQIPTTLLACVDASIGGKTGVNLPAGKNLAGAFWQPELVLADTDVFATLTEELWQDGLAEMVKAGMIGDPSLLRDLADGDLRTMTGDALTDLILKALAVKAEIVAKDERETGPRRMLNFGHTAGHAIETCSGFEISHGRAVAAGM
ncbi:MAG: 3-dehydroquinate synthase, partial [Clostridiales bacterium]|nr:3-dehydroquinate synthase [Clostridiales bacterium]